MNSKIGSYEFVIDHAVCDLSGKAPLPHLFGLLLKSAGRHADERGFGFTNLSQQNKAWVLSRVGIYLNEYPSAEDKITIHTWVESVEWFISRRCFEFVDTDGKIMGIAQTIWAAIDLETRKPCNIDELGSSINDFLGADKSFAEKKMVKIGRVEEEPLFLHSLKYSDIDINGHFNSVRYVERILDVFDIEMFESLNVREFEITYMAEARPATKLSFHKKTLAEQHFALEIKDTANQSTICRASVLFQ